MERRNVEILGKLDWLTVLLVLVIMVCGWFSICGASANVENLDLFSFSTRPGKQMVWIICALVLGAAVLIINQNFLNSYAYVIYLALLLLLGLLLAIVVLAPVACMFLSSVMLPVPAKRSSARGASLSKSMYARRTLNRFSLAKSVVGRALNERGTSKCLPLYLPATIRITEMFTID